MSLQYNPLYGKFDLVNDRISGTVEFKGTIAVASDFPTLAVVMNGYAYYVTATVIDNNAAKTNTGQSFVSGDEIVWNGTNWTLLGNNASILATSNVWTGTNEFQNNTTFSGLTASRATYLDASKVLQASPTTNTELGYLSGVTSALQTQLNGKQATGNYITALTGEVTASGPGSVAATLSNSAVIAKVLSGYTSGAGTVTSSDSLLSAIQKLDGNLTAKTHNSLASLQGGTTNEYYHLTSAEYSGTGTGVFARKDSPVFTTLVTTAAQAVSGHITITSNAGYKIRSTAGSNRNSIDLDASGDMNLISAGQYSFKDAQGVFFDMNTDDAHTGVFFNLRSGSANTNIFKVAMTGAVTMTGGLTGATSITTTGLLSGINFAFYGTNATGNTNVMNNDNLTTGTVLALWSNSGSTSTRELAAFSNTNAGATGTTVVSITNASTGNALAVTGLVAINGTTTHQGTSSIVLANITGALRTGSIVLTAPYVSNGFTNALYWSTTDDNPAIPKAGIWTEMTGAGSLLLIGTSNNYSTGITSVGFVMDQNGAVSLGTASISTLTVSTSLTCVPSLIIGGQSTAASVGIELGNLSGGTPFIDWKLGNVDYNMRTILAASDTLYFSSATATGTVGFTTRIVLDGHHSFISASSNAYLYHSTTLGLVLYGAGSTDDITFAGPSGSNILSVASGTTTARFYGAVNIGGTFTRRAQSGVTSQFQIEGTGFDSSSMSLFVNEASGATTSPCLFLSRSRGSSVGSNTIVQSGDRVGLILFEGTDGTIPQPLALIQANVDGTPGANDMPGRLEFYTSADGSISPTLRLTIGSTGTATFTGAIAINNTVATGAAVASTHKVTVVIGGTTYYLLASNV